MTQETLPLEVCEKAMEWWLEINSLDVDPRTVAAFHRWRNETRLHDIAWQRAEALAGQMQAFRQAGDSGLAKRALLSPERSGISRRRAIKGLGLLLAAGATAWTARDTSLAQRFTADYSTGVGEQRKVSLSSEIELALNTRTAIDVQQRNNQWQIDLLRGEVLIETRATAGLLMRMAGIEAKATTAQFSTRLFDNGSTLLSVYKGSLQVSTGQGRDTTLLDQGQQARFSPHALLERHPLEQRSAPWAEGMIVAHGQPLEAFLQDLGRYRYGHLSCDPALARLRVWGTYPLADSDQVIDAVADTLKLEVQRFTRLWVKLRRPERTA
ncbi:FecR domain-containing protein [Pseudomonas sp. NPDC090203]|uniref:FecR domain-containing protein n=1 Tax=Pseudomonas sp. NPDC090203 TaxID=3364477 RepID=UPI0037F37A6F